MKYFGLFAIFLIFVFALANAFEGEDLAVGPCIAGKCQQGFICRNFQCYPENEEAAKTIKRVGGEPIGPCIDNLCPSGFYCWNGKCFNSYG